MLIFKCTYTYLGHNSLSYFAINVKGGPTCIKEKLIFKNSIIAGQSKENHECILYNPTCAILINEAFVVAAKQVLNH